MSILLRVLRIGPVVAAKCCNPGGVMCLCPTEDSCTCGECF